MTEHHQVQRQTGSMRGLFFRLIAMGVPTLIGGLGIYEYMRRNHFITQDATGETTIQRPIYLQEPGYQVTGHLYLYDQEFGWKNVPGMHATTYGQPLTINDQGLRDRSYSYEKPSGVSRILVLGDSFTWGYGVGDSEIYTEVLESELIDSERWQVINTGVSGWGNDQQLLFLRREGLKYQPDIVVLAFFLMNDPVENTKTRVYEMNKPVFTGEEMKLANVPVPKPGQPPMRVATGDEIETTLAIMSDLRDRCASAGARLVIMQFGKFLRPDQEFLQNDAKRVAAKITEWPEVGFLDLDAEFESKLLDANTITDKDHDEHWNAYGHRVTAEILHQYLLNHHYLDSTQQREEQ